MMLTEPMSTVMTSSANSSRDYQPAANHHDELMEIYFWPFVLVVIYTCIGMLGNAIVLYVYTFRWKHTITRIFIIMLAVMDFINSAFNMPIEAYILRHPLQFDNHWLCKMTRGVTFVINNVSACVFVAIAIDRILLVYFPLRRHVLTCKYAKIACLISFIVGLTTSWPGFVLYGTATIPEKLDDVVVIGKTCYLSDEFLRSQRWPVVFNTVLFVSMLVIFVILIVLYIIIGRKLCQISLPVIIPKKDKTKRLTTNRNILKTVRSLVVKIVLPDQTLDDIGKPSDTKDKHGHTATSDPDVNDNDQQMARSSQSDNNNTIEMEQSQTLSPTARRDRPRLSRRISGVNSDAARNNTITMLMITIAYVLCFLPYLVIVSLRYTDDTLLYNLPKNNRIAYHVFLRTYFFNSVINPFVYSFVNRPFKDTILRMVNPYIKRFKGCCRQS